MADDQSSYGPYIDEDQQYAGLLKNLINPPDAAPVKPAATPATSTPAQPAAQPAGLAPNQHWESVAPTPTPAATSTSGTSAAGGKTWQDYYQQGQGKLSQDQADLARLQNTGPGVSQIKNPILRTLGRVADAAASIAIPGAARNIPGTTQHNLQLQGQAQGRIGQDQASLQNVSQMEDRAAQAEQRKAQAEKEKSQADYYSPVTLTAEQANAVGHPELAGQQMSQRAYSTMIAGKARTDSAQTAADAKEDAKKADVPKNYEQAVIAANTEIDPVKKQQYATAAKQMQDAEVRRFTLAQRASKGPNEDLRQPLIDEATSRVQKLNDYQYDPEANDGHGGFYDPANPAKVYTPEEFTDQKNQIATKLDKDLATKKLRPLGVRFNVKDTTPGKAGQPTGAGAPAAAPAQTAPTPPAVPKEQMVEGRTGTDAQGNKWKVVGGQMKLIQRAAK